MFYLQSGLEGQSAFYGDIKGPFDREGFSLGGNWEFEAGYFDKILAQDEEGQETIYLRLPVRVTWGQLDQRDAKLEFGTPLVVKHVVHVGLETSSNEHILMDQAGLSPFWNQFQTPVDQDGNLKDDDKWRAKAEQAIEKVMPYVE